MTTMREIRGRLDTIRTEMRGILAAPAGEGGDLSAEQAARFDAIRGEADRLSANEARVAALDAMERRSAGQPVNGSGDARLDAELRDFSVTRALAGAAGLPGIDWGRERELGAEYARRSGRGFQGICIPVAALAETRAITTALPAGGPGGNIIATNLQADQLIDRLRAGLVVRQLGARILSGLVGNVAVPRLKASATAQWVAENTALTASDPQFDQVSLSPKTAGGIVEFSRNLLLQATPDVEQIVRGDLSAILAQALDSAVIQGGGANQPTGILAASGTGSVSLGTNGAALTYDNFVDLMGQIQDVNAAGGSPAFLTNYKVRRAVQKLKDTQGRPLGEAVVFQGQPTAFTTNVPSNLTKGSGTGLSAVIYGDFSQVLIGLWSELDILVNPFESTAYPKGNVQVRAMMTCDVALRHPESFAVIRDAAA